MRQWTPILLVGCGAAVEPSPIDTARPVAPWPSAEQEVYALSGEITWEVDFDEAAEASGKTDCSYTRRYTALEDRSRPWTCRSCNVILRADIEMISGREDCFAQVSESDPEPVEWVGYGGGTWYRSTRENRPLGTSATASVTNGAVHVETTIASTSFDDHALVFRVSGDLAGGVAIGDPLDGLAPPQVSACDWDRSTVEVYDGSTTIAVGSTLPDAYLPDRCGEGVRLHQLTGNGRYAVVAWVAGGHAGSEEWLADASAAVADRDPPVLPIALWSLANTTPWPSPTREELEEASSGRGFPVLGHRGYGRTVLAGEVAYQLPVVAAVAPDRKVIHLEQVGFGGWQSVLEAIEDHAAMR